MSSPTNDSDDGLVLLTVFDSQQLAALMAIVEAGTFDAAAKRLHVTGSAISQRIKALESAVGSVVVQRTTPCRPTASGEVLLRLARQMRLLADEVAAALRVSGDQQDAAIGLPLAVNADSLATWFRPVLSWPARRPHENRARVALDIRIEDQGFTADLLRRGEVLAAITSSSAPVQGCSVRPLGAMRYFPAAAPALAATVDGGGRWGHLPVAVFNDKDDLQVRWAAGVPLDEDRVVHRIPSSADFLEAVCRGLGWGAIPELQLQEAGDRLVRLSDEAIAVPLYWQRWKLASDTLDELTEQVVGAAVEALSPPDRPEREVRRAR